MRSRLIVVLGMALMCAVATAIVIPHPVPQDQQYHHFADTRAFAGIPNFANVASNIVFVLAGIFGLIVLPPTMICVGGVLTGIGSAIYHLRPSDRLLVFDRIGIVVVVAAFTTLLLEQFAIRWRWTSLVLLAIGFASLLCWLYLGDLRPYGFFQGFPIVLFVVGSFLFPHAYTRHGMLWLATIAYVLAKTCEVFDRTIYQFGGVVSGHTLKHLLAGAALMVTINWLRRRELNAAAAEERIAAAF